MKPFNLSQYMFSLSQAAGAGLVGYNAANTYAAGTVGAALKQFLPAAAFTTGSVPFAGASGALTQDNANLFWDATNLRLGVGTGAPQFPLHQIGASAQIRIESTLARGSGAEYLTFGDPGGTTGALIAGVAGTTFKMSNYISGGPITFETAGGVERMRIMSTGNVGINTTNPGNIFEVLGSGEIGRLRTTAAHGTGNNYLTWYDPNGRKGFIGYGGTTTDNFNLTNEIGDLFLGASGNVYLQPTGGYTLICNAGVEMARFAPDGGFYHGSTGDDFGQTWKAIFRKDQNNITAIGLINGTAGASARAAFQYITGTGNSFVTEALYDNAGSPYFSVATGSAVQSYQVVVVSNGVKLVANGTSWGAVSDETLKDIIEPITDGADKVSTLRAVIGKFKIDEEGTRRPFLIAQDVQKVLPEAVIEDPVDGTLILHYTEVIPLLVSAIKELTDRLAVLEAKP